MVDDEVVVVGATVVDVVDDEVVVVGATVVEVVEVELDVVVVEATVDEVVDDDVVVTGRVVVVVIGRVVVVVMGRVVVVVGQKNHQQRWAADGVVLDGSSRMALQLAVPGAAAAHTGTGVQVTLAGEWAGTGVGESPEAPEAPEDKEACEPATPEPEAVTALGPAVGVVAAAEPATRAEALRADGAATVPTDEEPAKAPIRTKADPEAMQATMKPRTAAPREEGNRPMASVTLNHDGDARQSGGTA